MCRAVVEHGHSATADTRRPASLRVLTRSGASRSRTSVRDRILSPPLSFAQRVARYNELRSLISLRLSLMDEDPPRLRSSFHHMASAPPSTRLYYQTSYPSPDEPLSSKGAAQASAQPHAGMDLLRAAKNSGLQRH